VTADILIREDTGSFAAVRPVDEEPFTRSYTAAFADINRDAAATIDRVVHSVKRRMFRDLDIIKADALAGARLPEQWPTADDLADHLGVDLLIENRWNPDVRSGQLIADVNAGLRRIWPPVQSESVKWAELPPEPAAELAPSLRRGWTPPRRPSDVLAEAYQERADAAEAYMRADTSDDMPTPDLVQTDGRRSWSTEWAAFRAEVKGLARDMWREFKRMWNVNE
jgi:hypothetical protein